MVCHPALVRLEDDDLYSCSLCLSVRVWQPLALCSPGNCCEHGREDKGELSGFVQGSKCHCVLQFWEGSLFSEGYCLRIHARC